MKKILFIAPHLSTGGMPQYLLKQIQSFKSDFDIYVLEVSNYSDHFTVQKNKIKELTNHYCTFGNTNDVLSIIEKVKPDIIHFQEIPETFLPDNICLKIFDDNRKYNIITTTHSSKTEPHDLIFLPDKFVLVNRWALTRFKDFFSYVPCDVWEYPIENKTPNKSEARKKLFLNDKVKHVINIGLFTPGKNQSELFSIARKTPDVTYHFIGNMAENFRHYWEPLMSSIPNNCRTWGERDDVDTFYQAADAFYFSSTLELNPLVVKEALGWNIPILMRKLDTYMDDYDNNPLVTYLTGDENENINLLKKVLGI